MANTLSGITEVHYSTDAFVGNDVTITGKVTADSTITIETITSDDTQGVQFGGESFSCDMGFFDFADYATIETAMKANTEYTWRFVFADGTTMTTGDTINPMVTIAPSPDKRQGLNAWRLALTWNSDDTNLTVA